MRLRPLPYLVFTGLAALGTARLAAQVQLDLSNGSTGGTGWAPVSDFNGTSQAFVDSNSNVKAGTNITATQAITNLVGGTGTGTSADYSVNPMLQIQTAFIGGTSQADLGVAFRLRLDSFGTAAQIQSMGGLTVMVGIGPAVNAGKATFVVGAALSSNGTAVTGTVFLLQDASGGGAGTAKPADWVPKSGNVGIMTPVITPAGLSGLSITNNTYLNYQSTANTANTTTTNDNGNDAYLTFGIKFSTVNANISAVNRANANYDNSVLYNYGFASFTGKLVDGGTSVTSADQLANNTTYFSSNIYTNGSTTTITYPAGYNTSAVPEPATGFLIGGLMLPGYLAFRAYRAKRARREAELAAQR